MTGWIIFGAIVLFIAVILWQSVTVTFVYENKAEIKVKFLFFTIYPMKPKKKKKPKKSQKGKKNKAKADIPKSGEAETAAPKPKAEEKPAETAQSEKNAKPKASKPKKEKFSFKLDSDTLDMVLDFIKSASPPIKRLFRKIRWYDVYIDWVVATDDAAKTALTYGGICSVLYPVVKCIETYFTAHIKEINVEADFSKEKSDIFAYFVLKLRLSTAVACALWLAVRVLKTYSKYAETLTPSAAKKGK